MQRPDRVDARTGDRYHAELFASEHRGETTAYIETVQKLHRRADFEGDIVSG